MAKAKTKKPTPETHPEFVHFQKYKMVMFNGSMQKTEMKDCVTTCEQFDHLRDMDAFRGFGIEVIHDPRTAKAKTTRTRKSKTNESE